MRDNQQRIFGKDIQNSQISVQQTKTLDKRRITRSLSSQISQKENINTNLNMTQIMEVEEIEPTKTTHTNLTQQPQTFQFQIHPLDLHSYNQGNLEAIYHQQIINYLKQREHKWQISIDYMQKQSQINAQMRLILVDWLCDVCVKFKFRNETFYLTVFIIDYYLQGNNVCKNKLQLVGIAALFVASKYEEIYLPETQEYARVSDGTYSSKELLKMESNILAYMQFDLSFGSFIQFYNRYAMFNQQSQKQNSMNLYILELTLLDLKNRQFEQNMLAAAVIFLTNKLFKNQQSWNSDLEQMTGYCQSELKLCAKYLLGVFQENTKSKYNAVGRKFQDQKYHNVSSLILEQTS